ncbi:MAG: hypothetical protein AABW83_01065 [Nanoarchaeota archaeon]
MDNLFHRQRRGYGLRLDEIINESIRRSRSEEINLRCDSFINLEENSEHNYFNLSILRKIFNYGLSRFKSVILKELNENLSKIKGKSYNGHYSRRRAIRTVMDEALCCSYEFIDNWEKGIKRIMSERNEKLEKEYRELMVDREIVSKGIKDSFLIKYNLEDCLNDNIFLDKNDYDSILDFSLKFIQNFVKKNLDERTNIYLFVNENSLSYKFPFPGGMIELLKKCGIIGDSLEHYFLHFPVEDCGYYNHSDKYFSSVFPNAIDFETVRYRHDIIARFYKEDSRFLYPKVAITVPDRINYLKNIFNNLNFNVVTII